MYSFYFKSYNFAKRIYCKDQNNSLKIVVVVIHIIVVHCPLQETTTDWVYYREI